MANPKRVWLPEQEALLKLHREKDPPTSYTEIAKILKMTRSKVISKWHRKPYQAIHGLSGSKAHTWDESALTERWTDRKARKATTHD